MFPEFLSILKAESLFMVYLLRGLRYEFSTPEDIDFYIRLHNRLLHSEGKGVSAVLMNNEGEILLHLRDNTPTINYPAHWGLLGGSKDPGERPVDAVVREIKEETHYEAVNVGLLREFTHNNKREYAFAGSLDAGLEDLRLEEGKEIKCFKPSELSRLKIRPDDRETLMLYFRDYFHE